jgi:ABC-type sugar transport system substrate-binding protein
MTNPDAQAPMTPAQLAAAVRATAARSAGALLLEPIDSPLVREALHEVEAKGLPIVLLDTPLPASSPGSFYPCVAFTGFADAGKRIVEAVVAEVQKFKLPEDGPALVLEYDAKDLYSSQRLDSLTSALKAAGSSISPWI